MKERRPSLRSVLPILAFSLLFGVVGLLSIAKPFVYAAPGGVDRWGMPHGSPMGSGSVPYGICFLLVAGLLVLVAWRVRRG